MPAEHNELLSQGTCDHQQLEDVKLEQGEEERGSC